MGIVDDFVVMNIDVDLFVDLFGDVYYDVYFVVYDGFVVWLVV